MRRMFTTDMYSMASMLERSQALKSTNLAEYAERQNVTFKALIDTVIAMHWNGSKPARIRGRFVHSHKGKRYRKHTWRYHSNMGLRKRWDFDLTDL